MQRCCKIIEIEYFMTSAMVHAGILSVLVCIWYLILYLEMHYPLKIHESVCCDSHGLIYFIQSSDHFDWLLVLRHLRILVGNFDIHTIYTRLYNHVQLWNTEDIVLEFYIEIWNFICRLEKYSLSYSYCKYRSKVFHQKRERERETTDQR